MEPAICTVDAAVSGKLVDDLLEFGGCHLGQVVKVDNRPTSRLGLAPDDVAACRFVVARAVEAVAEVDEGVVVASKRRHDLAGGCRVDIGQAGDQVRLYV